MNTGRNSQCLKKGFSATIEHFPPGLFLSPYDLSEEKKTQEYSQENKIKNQQKSSLRTIGSVRKMQRKLGSEKDFEKNKLRSKISKLFSV